MAHAHLQSTGVTVVLLLQLAAIIGVVAVILIHVLGGQPSIALAGETQHTPFLTQALALNGAPLTMTIPQPQRERMY